MANGSSWYGRAGSSWFCRASSSWNGRAGSRTWYGRAVCIRPSDLTARRPGPGQGAYKSGRVAASSRLRPARRRWGRCAALWFNNRAGGWPHMVRIWYGLTARQYASGTHLVHIRYASGTHLVRIAFAIFGSLELWWSVSSPDGLIVPAPLTSWDDWAPLRTGLLPPHAAATARSNTVTRSRRRAAVQLHCSSAAAQKHLIIFQGFYLNTNFV